MSFAISYIYISLSLSCGINKLNTSSSLTHKHRTWNIIVKEWKVYAHFRFHCHSYYRSKSHRKTMKHKHLPVPCLMHMCFISYFTCAIMCNMQTRFQIFLVFLWFGLVIVNVVGAWSWSSWLESGVTVPAGIRT